MMDPLTPEADDLLLRSLAESLDRAFPDLVTTHQDRLYTIALRMLGDPNEAEEATQDALVRAYRALATFDRARMADLRLRGWLATIVLNRCRSRLSRRLTMTPTLSLDVVVEGGAEPVSSGAPGPEAMAVQRDARDAWAIRLGRLPTAYRAAVILHHVDGLTYPEMAEALGRPEGTLKAQVHRGLAALRTMLETEGGLDPEEISA